MLLADYQITARLTDGSLRISPCDSARIQPASVDLTLDSFIRLARDPVQEIDVAAVPADHTHLVRIPVTGWVIAPGDFLLASTAERIELPGDLAGRVEGKSSLGRLGLAVHITAGFIDPGFHGQITLEIANVSPWPIRLRERMPIAQIGLMPMSAVPERLYGNAGNHYQNQVGPVESRFRMG